MAGKAEKAVAEQAGKIDALSFEQALSELEQIVRRLESGEVDLDNAISAYERGARLRKHCEDKLRQAQEKVEKIQPTADGGVSAVDAGFTDDASS